MPDFAALREDYRHAILDESDVDPDPIRQFSLWFDQALSAGLKEANAMALATATRDGVPAVRMVLLKGFDEHGFVFFSNYESRKGRELAQNPRAALCFYWTELSGRYVSPETSRKPPGASRLPISTPARSEAGSAPPHLHRAP